MAGDGKYRLDIFGGINQGADPTDIEDNEFSSLFNWYPYAGRLKRRGGLVKINSDAGAYFENITNAFAYTRDTGEWVLAIGGLTSLGKLDGTSLTQITHIDGTTYTSSTDHWSFEQYKNILYAARIGSSFLQRSDMNIIMKAGIEAPLTAPTIAEGAAGNLVAGDYISVVTFYNSETDAESNPSPNSSTLTLGAAKKIEWSNIPTSSNPQVNARRLYRTQADQQGQYYFVAQIDDNVTTTYSDNIVDTNLGEAVSNENATPPTGLRYLEIWQERLWASDGESLFFSGVELPESFFEFDVIVVSPDDGHKITGIMGLGDRLLVGKTNQVAVITDTGTSFNLQTLTHKHGVYSHHSMKEAEGFAFWFGGDNFYQTDGNVVRSIGDIKVRDFLDGINSSNYHLVISTVDTSRSWYMSCIPYNDNKLNVVLVYNYKDEVWSAFDFRGKNGALVAPAFMADFFDANGLHIIYCNLNDGEEKHIMEFDSGNLDVTRPIECFATTKHFGGEGVDTLKYIKEIGVQASLVNENINCSLIDESANVIKGPTSVYMGGTHLWKRLPLSNNGSARTSMAIKLTSTSVSPIDILGLMFNMVDTGRQVRAI